MFLPFMLVTLFCNIYIYLIVPETLGKSVLEIQVYFDERQKHRTLTKDNEDKKDVAEVKLTEYCDDA